MDSSVDKIVEEVKSRGVFDKFRRDLMADIDTKPAYLNLIQRVQNTVYKFLSSRNWSSDMNKIHMRERLRRHIADSNFLDLGVERIVDQVVNPKISTCFQPQIESIAYEHLGIGKPGHVKHEMHLNENNFPVHPPQSKSNGVLFVNTSSISDNLHEELEQISPDSDKTNKSYSKGSGSMDTSEDRTEDYESPEFEPLENMSNDNIQENERRKNYNLKEEQESNLSQISSLSMVLSDHSVDITANISEEAQMPKFNDNSCSAYETSVKSDNSFKGFSFNITKDEIKFEGTNRKPFIDHDNTSPILSGEKGETHIFCNKSSDEILENTSNCSIGQKSDESHGGTHSASDKHKKSNHKKSKEKSSRSDRRNHGNREKSRDRPSERSKHSYKKSSRNQEKKLNNFENCSTATKSYRKKSTDSNDDGENVNGNQGSMSNKQGHKTKNEESIIEKSSTSNNKENNGNQESCDYEEPLYYFDDLEMAKNMENMFSSLNRDHLSSAFYRELVLQEDSLDICSQRSCESHCSSVSSKKRKSDSLNATRATLIIDCIQCDSIDQFKRKKYKNSPTTSELSHCSKENLFYEKHNTDDNKDENHKSTQADKKNPEKKVQNTANQRYSTQDLYKPRSFLSQRSKRRGLESALSS